MHQTIKTRYLLLLVASALLFTSMGVAVAQEISLVDTSAPAYVTEDDLDEALRTFSWKKGDLTITPYGIAWLTASYDSARTFPGPHTVWTNSPDVEGEDATHIDVRYSRLGIEIQAPGIDGWEGSKVTGRFEGDFLGGFSQLNRSGFRIRHAYAQIADDHTRILIGQNWDIVSPLNPKTLNFIPWLGNIGFRRAQIMIERKRHLDQGELIFQGAIAANVFQDNYLGPVGETSDWPDLQGRVALNWDNPFQASKPISVGISGHIGEHGYDLPLNDDLRRNTHSFNIDVMLPISDRLSIQGEYFTGSNLSSYFGGILQGIDPTTYDDIHTKGGWMSLDYKLSSKLSTTSGYAVEDPRDTDFSGAGRSYNDKIWGNLRAQLNEYLMVGVEYAHYDTHYLTQTNGSSDRFEFLSQLKF